LENAPSNLLKVHHYHAKYLLLLMEILNGDVGGGSKTKTQIMLTYTNKDDGANSA
jgi:hypothetical protein